MMTSKLCGSLALLTIMSAFGCAPAPIPAPGGFYTYNSDNDQKTFRVGKPKGWAVEGGGKNNAWAKFSNGSALVEIRTDLSGSLMGDLARLNHDPDDPMTEPVAVMHTDSLPEAEEKFADYKEQPMQDLDSKLGPGRVSEFTASSEFGRAIYGYRATILSRDRRIVTYCTSDESDWDTLSKWYMDLLKTFARQV